MTAELTAAALGLGGIGVAEARVIVREYTTGFGRHRTMAEFLAAEKVLRDAG